VSSSRRGLRSADILYRNLQEEDDVPQTAHTGMGVKISLGTYRMFFVDGECRSPNPGSRLTSVQAERTFTAVA
jgi:hypothetical protein